MKKTYRGGPIMTIDGQPCIVRHVTTTRGDGRGRMQQRGSRALPFKPDPDDDFDFET